MEAFAKRISANANSPDKMLEGDLFDFLLTSATNAVARTLLVNWMVVTKNAGKLESRGKELEELSRSKPTDMNVQVVAAEFAQLNRRLDMEIEARERHQIPERANLKRLSQIYARLGRYEEAANVLSRDLTQPDQFVAESALLLNAAGKGDLALASLNEFVERASTPTADEAKWGLLGDAAKAFVSLDKIPDAIRCYELAASRYQLAHLRENCILEALLLKKQIGQFGPEDAVRARDLRDNTGVERIKTRAATLVE